MRRVRLLSLQQIIQVRNCSDGRKFQQDILPNAEFNPFEGGIKFPSIEKGSLQTETPSKLYFGSKKRVYDSKTKQYYSRNVSIKSPVLLTTPDPGNVSPSNEIAERLLRHDDSTGKREREICARLAVRKLMALHFNAQRAARAEAVIAKQDGLSVTNRYLEERQKIKEANATAALLSGISPMPTAAGVVSAGSNYPSVATRKIKRMDERATRQSAAIDRISMRTKGSFVATPENTAGLLKEAGHDIEEPDWEDVGSGRSMDDILNSQDQSQTSTDSSTVPVEEEWGDAYDTTFHSANDKKNPSEHDAEELDESSFDRLSDGASKDKAHHFSRAFNETNSGKRRGPKKKKTDV